MQAAAGKVPAVPWDEGGSSELRRGVLQAWTKGCRARGGDLGSPTEALLLVTALVTAPRAGTPTPDLGRAARTWGARFTAPADALGMLVPLRDAVLERPVPDPALARRLLDDVMAQAVDAASGHLRASALQDHLTGCANRRALDEDLTRAITAARREGLDLSAAVAYLDGLKQINDRDGHAAGDATLLQLVKSLRAVLRDADTLYRAGGDEFVVVAPFTDAAGARALMKRAEQRHSPAFSYGVADLATTAGPFASSLLAAADADLYVGRRAVRRPSTARSQRGGGGRGLFDQLRRSRSTDFGTAANARSTSPSVVFQPNDNRTA